MTTELEYHDRGKPATIVSFTGIGHGMGAIQRNEFFRLTQSDYNVLFVRDTARSWYNAVDVNAIRAVVNRTAVTTIGNSMGAFHAAMFALDHPVERVIAVAVQYSIHPEEVPFDRRYRRYAAAIENWKYRTLQFTDRTEYHFISGDDRLESRHLDLIPDRPNIHKTVIPRAGHKVAEQLKRQGRLYSVIYGILNGAEGPSARSA